MNYELYESEAVTASTSDTIYQELACIDSQADYDHSKSLDGQEWWPRHAEALSQITGPLDASGNMRDGWRKDPAAISGYWLWTIYGPTWMARIAWIRIRP